LQVSLIEKSAKICYNRKKVFGDFVRRGSFFLFAFYAFRCSSRHIDTRQNYLWAVFFSAALYFVRFGADVYHISPNK
jgi:phosphoglycerol transferase MdoB-like AlkP superfamily enzyme